MAPTPDPAEFVQETYHRVLIARALAIVAELAIADHLAAGPRTAAQLAPLAAVQPAPLYRVLRMLAARGFFAEDAQGAFALTPAGQQLRADHPESLRDRLSLAWQDLLWDAYRALPEALRAGETAFDLAHGRPLFDHLASQPALATAFGRAMARVSAREEQLIARHYDFARYACVVDVGGGRGGLLAAVLAAHPAVRGVLFDRPEVLAEPVDLPVARHAARCEVVTGDFFVQVPGGGDLYVLKRILHDWDDAAAARVLRVIRGSAPAGSRLLVLEAVVRPGNAPDPAKDQDVSLMALTPGRERTAAEYERLLAAAGFALDEIRALPAPTLVQMLTARPA